MVDPAGGRSSAGRPFAIRGDYFVAGSPCARAYFTNPCREDLRDPLICEPMPQRAWPDEDIVEGTYLGPVHLVDGSEANVSILVPHPFHDNYPVWIRVWRSWMTPSDPMQLASTGLSLDDTLVHLTFHTEEYASLVEAVEVQRWREKGWQDRFIFSERGSARW